MKSPIKEVSGKVIRLEREYFVFDQIIADYPLVELNKTLEIHRDYFNKTFVLTLKSFLAKIDTEIEVIETPLTWWDHFKHQYFSKWLKEKFPVKYQKHKVLYRKLCPHITDKWSDNSYSHLYWMSEKNEK